MHGVALWQGIRQRDTAKFFAGIFSTTQRRCSVRLWLIGRKNPHWRGLVVDWYPAEIQGPSTAHDLSKKTERSCSARDDSASEHCQEFCCGRNSDTCRGVS